MNFDKITLDLNLVNFVEIYKELSSINQNINTECNKLNNILANKTCENDENINKIELAIEKREIELNKLKKL